MKTSRARRLKVPRRIAACYQVASFYCLTADEDLILYLSLAYISPSLVLRQHLYIHMPFSFIFFLVLSLSLTLSLFFSSPPFLSLSFHSLSFSLFLLVAAFSSYRGTEAPRLILLRRRASHCFFYRSGTFYIFSRY